MIHVLLETILDAEFRRTNLIRMKKCMISPLSSTFFIEAPVNKGKLLVIITINNFQLCPSPVKHLSLLTNTSPTQHQEEDIHRLRNPDCVRNLENPQEKV